MKSPIERWLEKGLFTSRWLMAPFYLGLVVSLVALLIAFVNELVHELAHVATMSPDAAILLALSLIDLSLAANLVLIVIFSGYENFVSKFNIGDHEDRPGWMGTVDFSGLKLKLIASIVAISGIALLKAFLEVSDPEISSGHASPLEGDRLMWMIIVHLSFVLTGVLLALMDYLAGKAKSH